MHLPSVIFASSFIPPEWIAAHGLTPSRVTPSAEGAPEAEGLCPFAGAFAAAARAPSVAGVVFATTCDQMRRVSESDDSCGPPRFVLHVPSTWQTPAAHRFFQTELARLGRFLEGIGGRPPPPDRLAGEMERFETMRARLLGVRAGMSSAAHATLTAQFHATGDLPERLPPGDRNPGPTARPLMLMGGPLRAEDLGLFTAIDRAGGRVVVDATESGEREWPRRFDRRRMRDDAPGELADAYFGHIPAVFRRPNSGLFEWLAAALQQTPLRGIVFVSHPWCDLWRAELPRIREASSVPVLGLDLGGGGHADGAWTTRIQAFLEMTS
ncbi:MAG: 2-hydroxyacyl-CoA dehydratase family protein [Verrucomicrobia bacterium]|nr:2-hydroxyacyl-CoA dehydratase family protein [Verrucomicrobiota bacterium]